LEAGSFVENLVVFGRLLRRVGFDVPVGRILDLTEALTHVDLDVRDEVFHTCRALLVQRHDQLTTFGEVFDAFWRDHGNPFAMQTVTVRDARTAVARTSASAGVRPPEETASGEEEKGDAAPEGVLQTWSEIGGLAHKDFAAFSDDEIARARFALDRLEWIPGERRTRRWVRGRGPRVDVRRALMRSLRTGGEVIALPRRRRRTRPRPLVLLCDVSGSMERYSRLLLHFAHGLSRRGRLEVFLFATGLTRVTREIRARGLQDAVDAVSGVVRDWSGGTRIGPALRQFHQRWARRVLHQSPVVLLISDGWDRGDPHVLREEVARLQRSCHRLIWLNPLIGTIDYAPLTRGLQAALPFVDDFLPARTLADLAELAIHLSAVASDAPARRRRTRM
jgi:uncharacterized protein with von Willebrand factor type A (vWA) domain